MRGEGQCRGCLLGNKKPHREMELVLANNRRPRLQMRPRPLPMGGKYDPPSSGIYFVIFNFSLSFFYFFSKMPNATPCRVRSDARCDLAL